MEIPIAQFHYKIRHSYAYKQWKKQVLERDNYTCQKCGTQEGPLHTHHIKPIYENLNLVTDPSNGLTVCPKCHRAIHKSEKTDTHKNVGKTLPASILEQFKKSSQRGATK